MRFFYYLSIVPAVIRITSKESDLLIPITSILLAPAVLILLFSIIGVIIYFTFLIVLICCGYIGKYYSIIDSSKTIEYIDLNKESIFISNKNFESDYMGGEKTTMIKSGHTYQVLKYENYSPVPITWSIQLMDTHTGRKGDITFYEFSEYFLIKSEHRNKQLDKILSK